MRIVINIAVMVFWMVSGIGGHCARAAESHTCPGWTDVPTEWNGSVKAFCSQYGDECRAVSMMYEPPANAMALEPLYGDYDENALVSPDNPALLAKPRDVPVMQARQIDCEPFTPSPQQLAQRAADQQQKDECLARHGRWDRMSGRGHVTGCNLPTSDSGKECRGKAGECEGMCVNFTCYGWKEYRGCGVISEKGETICME